ncbi:MAG: glutathione peroxidase [Burkholderiales bacterium]|jgi:glutathione peroxidase|nr:glutathione peroxidase [Burkholderiales bacterium]MCE2645454.1 glutathione peroxidase [Burkholderiaceae bacterium]
MIPNRFRRRLALGAALWVAAAATHAQSRAACPTLLNHRAPRLQDEAVQDLCQYAGQVLLVVNTASFCGFTPQYEAMEALFGRYAQRGFQVLGFPSNDFRQESSDRQKIAELCFNTYGVKFPMFTPIQVRGAKAHPLYQELARAGGEPPRWNFHKYLVDRRGRVVASYPSDVSPLDPRVTARIELLLAEK